MSFSVNEFKKVFQTMFHFYYMEDRSASGFPTHPHSFVILLAAFPLLYNHRQQNYKGRVDQHDPPPIRLRNITYP
jgi:hypothetical protein